MTKSAKAARPTSPKMPKPVHFTLTVAPKATPVRRRRPIQRHEPKGFFRMARNRARDNIPEKSSMLSMRMKRDSTSNAPSRSITAEAR